MEKAAITTGHSAKTRQAAERGRLTGEGLLERNGQSVKANALCFAGDPGAKGHGTKTVWVHDLRASRNSTLKTKRMMGADLDQFGECYRPEDRHNHGAGTAHGPQPSAVSE
ncbi:MAG: hypothetical protein JXQ29_06600 [Planctomycetes bacterium]|nr:hypothetical protein [Planctomycetota bacterium]